MTRMIGIAAQIRLCGIPFFIYKYERSNIHIFPAAFWKKTLGKG